jgi:micrococcal nuclease
LLGPSRLRELALGALLTAVVAAGCGDSSEPAGRVASKGAYAEVVRVADGDTLRLERLGLVRLIGIDTPEVYFGVECFGREASEFTKRLAPPGTRVRYRLGIEERDRHGRALAYVWLPDGRMLNRVLIEEGYAQLLTIPPNVAFADVFRAGARAARQAGLGLWRACGAAG